MKLSRLLVSVLAIAMLAGCGNSSKNPSDPTVDPNRIVFDDYTLEELHTARVNRKLQELDKKYVSIKGQVTFAKRVDENTDALFIQNGKYGVEVTYGEPYSVNVGESIEVRGQFLTNKLGDINTIFITTNRETSESFNIRVINQIIEIQTPEIKSESDLLEYDSSFSSIDFTVTNLRNNAAFVGKIDNSTQEYVVANKRGVAEKFPEGSFKVGDTAGYKGIFTYGGDDTAKVIRYLDKDGFIKTEWSPEIDKEMRKCVDYVVPYGDDIFDPDAEITYRGQPENFSQNGYFYMEDKSAKECATTSHYGEKLIADGFVYNSKTDYYVKDLGGGVTIEVTFFWYPQSEYDDAGNRLNIYHISAN